MGAISFAPKNTIDNMPQPCLELDHGDGLLPFHRWSNGYLPLETIEKPSLPMVAGLQNH